MAVVETGRTLLAPNAELAAALFAAVERGHQAAGRAVWPTPRVRDFGSWLREQHAARQLLDATSPRLLGDVDERELWRTVIDSSDVGRDVIEPIGAAHAARRARRALYEYGIPLRSVAEHGAAAEESQAFLDWNRRFDDRCRELNCISADDLLGRALPPAEPIMWIESPVWRPMARHWLQRHGSMLAPPINVSRSASRLKAASPAVELAAIADWALVNLRSSERFRAWICVPDLSRRRAEVVDAFDAALAPARFSLSENPHVALYAVGGGTPLSGFAPVRAALDTLDASLGVVAFERFSTLLRSPELQAFAADAGAAALLDVQVRKRGPSDADLWTWLELAEGIGTARGIGPIGALSRLQGTLRTLEEVRGSQPLSRWAAIWIRAFDLGPWAFRQRWSSTEYQAAERFRELLASLATADSFFGAHSRSSAQRILRRAAHDTPFQVQTGVPPIWVSGQLIDPWLNYDGLWVSGCNEERWPPPVEPIPLLPVRLQRDFGVIPAAAESQLQFALELQSRWAARAVHCVFSYADPGDGRHASPSPLLPNAVAPPSAAQSPTQAPAQSAALPQPHWHALLRSAPRLERLTDELAPPFAADEKTHGVATLKAQSLCAFRGFAHTRLDTDRLERPVPGFNERERGELIHHALEHIWSQLHDSAALHSITREDEDRLLADGVARALEQARRVRDPGARWRMRERDRMHGLLRKWLDIERQRQPFEVERTEHGAEVARHAGLEFKVRIDRMDRLADGARVLIDYKTGMASTDWRGDRPDNPQLPIYALLHPQNLIAVAYGLVNAGDCSFIAEAERQAIFRPRGRRSSLEGEPNFPALIEVWSQRIENLAADFAAGRAAVAPTLNACMTCRLQGLCRVPAALEAALEPHD
ncbi:MAG: PD-(D/E)XK nuclease family protein [Gammaproteobacteria bacterium]